MPALARGPVSWKLVGRQYLIHVDWWSGLGQELATKQHEMEVCTLLETVSKMAFYWMAEKIEGLETKQ